MDATGRFSAAEGPCWEADGPSGGSSQDPDGSLLQRSSDSEHPDESLTKPFEGSSASEEPLEATADAQSAAEHPDAPAELHGVSVAEPQPEAPAEHPEDANIDKERRESQEPPSSSTGAEIAAENPETPSSSTGAEIGAEEAFLISQLEAANLHLEQSARARGDALPSRFDAAKRAQTMRPPDRTTSFRDSGAGADGSIDWDLWDRIVRGYDGMVRREPKAVLEAINGGVPESVRGLVWQRIAKSQDAALEETYRSLLILPSAVDKQIVRDLARTFPQHPHFNTPGGAGQTSLYNVIRTYSVYDPEVGYCQGLSFIVGCLVLCMPDEEAFCLLVKLMTAYGMRGLYTPKMEGLQLRLFQFDRVLERELPRVAAHFAREGVRSSMYASQWFLTLFAYRFPLDMVFRILDVVLAEGFEFVFRVSMALMRKNVATLLHLGFEALIEYLKHGLFDAYIGATTALIRDARRVNVTPGMLQRFENQFRAAEARKPSSKDVELEALRREARRQTAELVTMREQYAALSRELQFAQNRVQHLSAVNQRLAEDLAHAERGAADLRALFAGEVNAAEKKVAGDLDALAGANARLSRRNVDLEEQAADQLQTIIDAKLQLAQSQLEAEELRQQVQQLQRANGGSMRGSTGSGDSHGMPSPWSALPSSSVPDGDLASHVGALRDSPRGTPRGSPRGY